MRFYLEKFEQEKAGFLSAWKSGEKEEAKKHLLSAGRFLFLAAEKEQGRKQKQLMEKGRKLLEMAQSIKERGEDAKIAQGEAEAEAEKRRWKLEKKPDIKFSDVAGLNEAKTYLKNRVIDPLMHPEIGKKFKKKIGGGLLLYGPPGTGKTMLGKAIASEIDSAFYSVRCSDVISKWVGESESNIKELFETARKEERSVIFLDEIEALIPRRGGHSTVMNRVVPEILSQIDGLDTSNQCLLIVGATNRPWDLDDAMLRPGRFDKIVYVGLPETEARKLILEKELANIPIDQSIDLNQVVAKLEGYSGADITGLIQDATDFPFEREVENLAPQKLMMEDLETSIRNRKPSTNMKMIKKLEQFKSSRTGE